LDQQSFGAVSPSWVANNPVMRRSSTCCWLSLGTQAFLAQASLPTFTRFEGDKIWRRAQETASALQPSDRASETYSCGSGNWGDSGILDQWDAGRSPCWPSSLNIGASWDVELMERWATETANEFGAVNRGQLGPGINVARFAWNGRLGEYHSGEDPYLGAKMVAAMMRAYRQSSTTGVMPPLQVAKHFIANTIENDRTSATAYIDERTLFEVYYPPFEAAIEGGVSAIMCSYNLVQCTSGLCNTGRAYACGNDDILNKHLKQKMGFKGMVMSDWDATKCQPAAVGSKGCGAAGDYISGDVAAAAGLDLEMPACMTFRGGSHLNATDRAARMWWAYLVQGRSFNRGRFSEADKRMPYVPPYTGVQRRLQEKSDERKSDGRSFCCWWPQAPANNICGTCTAIDYNFPHDQCRGAGTWCEGGDGPGPSPPAPGPSPTPPPAPTPPTPAPVLPERCPDRGSDNYKSPCKLQLAQRIVAESTTVLKNTDGLLPLSKTTSVALVGAQACASDPLAIAGGSGWNGMACQDVHKKNVKEGLHGLGVNSVSCPDNGGHNSKADTADVVVAVVVPAKASEGSDRETLQLSGSDTQLIKSYTQQGKKVIVAMNAPGPMITSTWDSGVSGLLVSWLPGVVNGDGIARALLNETYEASGRLPVTFPKCSTDACSIQDERASVALGDEIGDKSYYHHREKALIGYRWYHAKGLEVSYPFGYGLFAYGKSSIAYFGAKAEAGADSSMSVTVTLENTGAFSGRDVPQLYLKFPDSVPGDANSKPEWQLKGFQKVSITSGASVDVSFSLSVRDMSYWDDAPGMSKWVCASSQFTACVGANARDAIVPEQGSCATFASPCSAGADPADIVVKAAIFDADAGQFTHAQAHSPASTVFMFSLAISLLTGVGLTLRRVQGRRFDGSSDLSDSWRAWQLLGLEEQPLTREDSCVE